MRSLISHLRHTIRRLIKTPGFTITAVLILGLGIGANTAIFSLINAVLLKPLPYPHSEQLVQISQPYGNTDKPFDYPDYVDFRASQHSFQDLALYLNDDFNLAGHGVPERISGMYVSGPFFRLLGRPLLLGRSIGEAEDRPDASGVVVVSEHFWRAHFHGDPSVIGTNLLLNGRSFQVIGVTPAQANELATVDLYVPLNQSPYYGTVTMTQRSLHFYSCVGRLKSGTTLKQARADLEVIQQNLGIRYPEANAGVGVKLVPYFDLVIGDYVGVLGLIEAAVGCLLLITCANIADLLLVRTRERRKEINIRAALGANRRHLIVQLLLESLVLAFIGGIIGLLLSYSAIGTIRFIVPAELARFQEVRLDSSALVFVLIITLLTALLSGLVPAFANSRANLASALKQEGDRGGTAGRERNRGQAVLVAAQVALTSVLLISAGLLLRSFQALQRVPLGFSTDHVLTADLYLTDSKYATQAECQVVFDRLLAGVKQLPGVVAAGLDTALPFLPSTPLSVIDTFWVRDQPEPEQNRLPIWQLQFISPDYFRTVSIPLLRGRTFTNQEKAKVVVISQSVADRFFPGQDPIGKQIYDFHQRFGLKQNFYTVIGVVGNVQYDNPEAQPTKLQAYYLYAENDFPTPANFGTLVIHADGDPHSLIAPLEKLVADIDPNLPISNIGLFDSLVAKSFAIKRLAAVVVSFFSAAALLLAAVGLYGVLSYSVAQRKREIGVRIALGAQGNSILQLVIKQGLKVVGVGLVIGVGAALVLSHLIANILYGVSATDPLSIGVSILVLSCVALIACLLPALRASRINAITALRE